MVMASTPRMRVAHVIHSMGIGGMERVVATLMERLDLRDYSSTVYCLASGGEWLATLGNSGFRTRVLGKKPGVAIMLAWRLAKLFKEDNIDLVHCHNFGGLTYGATAGRLAGARGVIYTAHGPQFPSSTRQVVFQRLPIIDCVVTVSEYLRRGAVGCVGINPDRVITIRNGVDIKRFAPADAESAARKRSVLGLVPSDRVVGVVARLTLEKDHATLVHAFSRVVAARPECKLIIIGDGDLRATLEKQCVELGIAVSVMFLGTREDVADLLAVFDVFVLPSKEEGLGITLLEAMAGGVPVIATSVGGIPEIVEHGITGIMVPPGDVAVLADAIEWYLGHADRAGRIAREARCRVIERFAVERMVDAYDRLYRDVLGRGVRRKRSV